MARWRAARLLEPWPPVLTPAPSPLPLALGIHEPLLARLNTEACSPVRFKRLLGAYTACSAYVTAIARAGALRHHLDANVVEPVSCGHREGARARLKERAERQRARAERAGAPQMANERDPLGELGGSIRRLMALCFLAGAWSATVAALIASRCWP